MTTHTHAAVVMTLPDDWAVIDLTDDDTRTSDVRNVVAARLGDDPRWAHLRAELTRELLDSTATAAAAHGVLVAMAVGDGVTPPLPASVSVHRLPGVRLDAHGRELLIDLARSDAEPGQSLDLGETPHGVVLRRVRAAADTEPSGREPAPPFVVDYWLEPTGSPDLLHLAFASPLASEREVLLEVFDGIADSVQVLGNRTSTHEST